MSSIVLLLISSAAGALTSYFFMGQDVLYSFDIVEKFKLNDIPYYILLGIITGFVSLYFTRTYVFLTKRFDKFKKWAYKLVTGGLLLGIVIFLFPSLYGEGYESINQCLHGNFDYLFNNMLLYRFSDNFILIVILLILILLLKAFATSITFASGGVGGVFAPSLFIGANTGLLFAYIANHFNINISVQNFALVGMGGLISGVIHAPLTAIFLIAEITSGYDLFMPLMITATISYATIKIFEKNSVYTFQLAERGELMTHDRDKSTFILMNIDELIERDFEVVHPDSTLKALVNAVSRSKRNVFPIVDDKGTMVGILTLNDIRKIMFKPELWDTVHIKNIMYFPEVFVSYYDTLNEIADKIETSGRYNVPVLKDGKYVGFVSRAKVFSEYRKLIKHFSEE
jgi:CIC family chloride channel protein